MSISLFKKSYCQELKVLDSVTKAIINNIKIKEQEYILNLSNVSNDGIIKFKKESIGKNITISHLGYLPKTFNISNNDTTVFLSENIIRLGEVVIKNNLVKTSIIGNYQKKTNNVFVNSRTDKDINFTVVNRFNSNNAHIEAILFYIAKDENYVTLKDIGSIEVVFYKENSNKQPTREPFYKTSVNNYSIGWNKILLPDLERQDQIIYYGIRWLFNPEKYHYINIKNKKKYNFFGPKLGVLSKEDPDFHQTFFFNAEKGWRQSSFSGALLALETIK